MVWGVGSCPSAADAFLETHLVMANFWIPSSAEEVKFQVWCDNGKQTILEVCGNGF